MGRAPKIDPHLLSLDYEILTQYANEQQVYYRGCKLCCDLSSIDLVVLQCLCFLVSQKNWSACKTKGSEDTYILRDITNDRQRTTNIEQTKREVVLVCIPETFDCLDQACPRQRSIRPFPLLRDIMSTSGHIMMHVGEQVGKTFRFLLKTSTYWTSPDVLMISPDVLMVSPYVLNIPWCTHGIPHMHHDIPRCTEHPPMYSWYNPPPPPPQCTHGIPPMYWTRTIG